MSRVKLGRKIHDKTRQSLEEEIQKYAADDYLWHRHITGVNLRPHQQVYSRHFNGHHTNLLIASRRLGKSFSVASYLLKEAVTRPRSEINIHAPALEQSKRNLRYMIDMVLNSEILMAYIEKKLGEGIGKESIEFINGSVIQAKGQASSVDGLGATHQWWEEVDDMDLDTLYERVYPTGSMIKPGYDYGVRGQCCRIATGTIKGMGNIYAFENPPEGAGIAFNVLPKYTGWHGVEWGIIPENDLVIARDVLMTPEQFARAYLCLYTESANFFPTRIVDQCQDPYIDVIDPVEYKKVNNVKEYQQAGTVTVGLDCGAQGTGEHPSKWSLTFTEDLGFDEMRWLYSHEWEATESPDVILSQMVDLLKFFMPARGYGDAFDTTFIHNLNRMAYRAGITRRNVDDAENRAGSGGWSEWFIVPVRFTGPNKHAFFKNLRLKFYQRKLKIPYEIDDKAYHRPLNRLRAQLENMRVKAATTTGYDQYEMIRNAIGDDSVDSIALAVYAQGELKSSVRPIGMSIESGGFREYHSQNVGVEQNFASRIGFKENQGPPRSMTEFLNND